MSLEKFDSSILEPCFHKRIVFWANYTYLFANCTDQEVSKPGKEETNNKEKGASTVGEDGKSTSEEVAPNK